MDLIKRTLLLALSAAACAVGAEEQPAAPLTLEAALAVSVENNPGLAEMRARSEAMAAVPSQAGALPDPTISFGAMNLPVDTFDTRQEPMTQLLQIGVSQDIPFPGKLTLKKEAAEFEAEAAAQNVTEARLRLRRDVKKTWWMIYYLDRALQIIAANQNLLRQFVEIAQTKYEVGEGLQQDVLLAQVELSRLLDSELRLAAARRNAASAFNALLDRPANFYVSLPDSVGESLPTLLPEDTLYGMAEESRALLAAQRQSIHAAQSRLDLAKKDYFPNFNVGASYGVRDDTPAGEERADFLSLKLSMNVPIFAGAKQSKAVDQRTSELMQKKFALKDEWNRVRSQISTAHSDYHQTKNQAVLFKSGIIPQARQTVASMLAGYQVNKVDFLNLVRSQITLFNYETQYWKALSEANRAVAELAAAVGKEEIYE
ncbi:MAG: TolC family protein [Gammaproteobacteria bacterium]